MPRSKNLDPLISINPANSTPVIPVNVAPVNKSQEGANRQRVYDLIAGKTKFSLSAFIARPKFFSFGAQNQEEEIIAVVRRHWSTNVGWITISLLMSLFPFLLTIIPIFTFLTPNYRFVSTIFWFLLTFAFAFENFLSWYFNVFIITEERVVDIYFFNLLDTKFYEAELNKIQDVTYTRTGISQTMFNYGTLSIQTAAETKEINVPGAPNPEMLAKILQELRLEEQQEELDGRLK